MNLLVRNLERISQARVYRFGVCERVTGLFHTSGVCLLALGMLFSVGCGGSEPAETSNLGAQANELPPPPAEEADRPTVDAEEAQPEKESADEGEMDAATVDAEPVPEEEVEEQVPEKRERPKDFAEWTLDEYRDEHAESGSRFQKGVEYLAENKVDDPETAQLLSELLEYHEPQAEAPPETDDERELRRYEQQKNSQLRKARSFQSGSSRAIIAALGLIGTDVSIDTLTKVIAGSLDTGLEPRRVCDAALKMLIGIRDDKVQEFIYLAVTAPAQVRPVDDGSFPPEQVQSRVVRELPSLAKHDLRTRLGKYAAEAGPEDPAFQGIWKLLVAPRADNLRGQLLLYLSPKLEERESKQLRNLFTQHSRRVLDDLLGVPVDAKSNPRSRTSSGSGINLFGGGTSRKASAVEDSDADLTYEVVRELWSLRFLAAVSSEMQGAGDMKSLLGVIDLIASIPVDALRQGAQGYLEEHWNEVVLLNDRSLPEKLANAVQDPGLLLVYKSVPRHRDPQVRAQRRDPTKKADARRKPRRATSPKKDPRQLKEESKYIWLETTELMVQAINARMHAAATAPDEAATEDDATPGSDAAPSAENQLPADFDLPFELHESAEIVVTHRVRWPDDAQDRIKDQKLSPLEVRYVRIECEDVVSKVTTHYQRQLDRPQSRYLENDGRWLDLVEALDTGWNQSTDIVVQRVAEKKKSLNVQDQRRGRNEKESLIVEILIIATEDATPDESEDDEDDEN